MAHTLHLPSTDLPDSTARLGTDRYYGAASTQTEQDSKTSPPRIIPADVGEKVGFLTLPREIRDQIYLNLVVAADPIQYDKHFETLGRSDTFTASAMMCMFEDGSNPEIARETRETFYEHNTFLVYTHDITALLGAKAHTMSFAAAKGIEPIIHSTPSEAGAWVRKVAVRVGWHASGGWFPDGCCLNPAHDLRSLLEPNGLQSVIIDARFGAWSYGYPQGIGWDLLQEMNEKWGKDFRIYNDQTLGDDTRRYTSDRWDLSDRWLLEEKYSQEPVEAVASVVEDDVFQGWGEDETEVEDENEDESEHEDESEEREEEENEDEGEEEGGAAQEDISGQEEEGGAEGDEEEAWSEEGAETWELAELQQEQNNDW
ncbi:MAG: hypothetical protein Q9175_002486 [Cornicularia normoerica]